MSASSTNNPRAQQMSLLWSLKLAIERAPAGSTPGVHYIHFNALRTDKAYRTDVIERALQSEVEEIRAVAAQVQALESPEETPANQSPSSHPQGPVSAAAPAPGYYPNHGQPYGAPPHLREKPQRLSGLATVGFTLVVIALLVGGYFATNSWLTQQYAVAEVKGSLTEDTLWTAGTTYHLSGLVFVEGKATLTIEPGTTILGEPGSALIVTRDASINARGKPDQPIVFTSGKPQGERARGDWGGVVLLGNAPVNTSVGYIEGIDRTDPRGTFGGANEAESCGMLSYVRIEFAGYEISKDNELNGLTLGGCGSSTIVDYVQVHMGLDDGIEFFGGTANIAHIVITRSDDDGLDWDRGWTGSGQFIVIQKDASGDNGIEADSLKADPNATPRSSPTLSNVTIVSANDPQVAQRGMTLRRGTAGDFRNMIIAGFSRGAIDVRDAATVEQARGGALRTAALIFTDAVDSVLFEDEAGENDDDVGFDEAKFFLSDKAGSAFIPDHVLPHQAYNLETPDFTPIYNEELMKHYAPIIQGEFWDEAANYVGAIRPGSRTSWLEGWTAFPAN